MRMISVQEEEGNTEAGGIADFPRLFPGGYVIKDVREFASDRAAVLASGGLAAGQISLAREPAGENGGLLAEEKLVYARDRLLATPVRDFLLAILKQEDRQAWIRKRIASAVEEAQVYRALAAITAEAAALGAPCA